MRFQKDQARLQARPSALRNLLGGMAMLALIVAIAVALQWARIGEVERRGQAEVIDGDSFRLAGHELRLKGLDAPEYLQTCTDASGRENACGKTARRALAALVVNHELTCTETEKDRYGRGLVTCSVEGRDIGEAMVLQGMAVAYGGYERAEAEARAAKRGIWAGSFERPADWRKRHPR
jgi:endonuclease YncB( thermonuclease family)